MERKLTREVKIGSLKMGGTNPIIIQSMCNTDTRDVEATVAQILALEKAGCELVRVAIPDMAAADAVGEIKKRIHIPLVADIHFDYRLALRVIELGIDKVRINPGNIGDEARIKQVVDMAKEKQIPIRIGVNSGSLEKELVEKYGGVTPQGLVESALKHVHILEKLGFYDIVVSIKASDVPFSIEAYRLLSEAIPYPIHVGITEAGTPYAGTIKSAVGIGTILAMGIGDTIRVSLTGDPIEEIRAAKEILKSLGLRQFGVTFVSCPTCGRTEIDLISIANEVEEKCRSIQKNIKVAVMGCVVNGPGEAKEADLGIAGGKGVGLVFKKGEIVRKVSEDKLVAALMEKLTAFNNKPNGKEGDNLTAQKFELVFQKISLSLPLLEAFQGTEVRKLTIHKKERTVSIEIAANKMIPLQKQEELKGALLESLPGIQAVSLAVFYELTDKTPEALAAGYWGSIKTLVSQKSKICAGVIADAEWRVTEHKLQILVKHNMAYYLAQKHLDDAIANMIHTETGETLLVQFKNQKATEADRAALENNRKKKFEELSRQIITTQAEAVQEKANAEVAAVSSSVSKGILLGKEINGANQKIIDTKILGENVIIEGSIYNIEPREIRGENILFPLILRI